MQRRKLTLNRSNPRMTIYRYPCAPNPLSRDAELFMDGESRQTEP